MFLEKAKERKQNHGLSKNLEIVKRKTALKRMIQLQNNGGRPSQTRIQRILQGNMVEESSAKTRSIPTLKNELLHIRYV